MNTSVVYLSYDGIMEPLGQSQVLCYLEQLAKDRKIFLISFEKREDWAHFDQRQALAGRIREAGITWLPLRYHKRPSALATALDITQGFLVAAWVVLRHRAGIVHARSYVPSVIALGLKKLFGIRYIFDMRGFWADERVDGGIWPKGCRLYRVAKWFEQRFLLNADRVVSLTQAAISEMRTFPYLQDRMPAFVHITTCADLELFRPGPVPVTGERPFTLGYVGSVGVWYLFDEALRGFQLLRKREPSARLHILNRGGHDYIRERMAQMGVEPASVILEEGNHQRVSEAMQTMDAGIFFIKPIYSKTASAPTKLGEFLGCGVPCLGNRGVGDMASILEEEMVGVSTASFTEEAMTEAVDRLLTLARSEGIRERCRRAAQKRFSLEEGARTYGVMYRELDSRKS